MRFDTHHNHALNERINERAERTALTRAIIVNSFGEEGLLGFLFLCVCVCVRELVDHPIKTRHARHIYIHVHTDTIIISNSSSTDRGSGNIWLHFRSVFIKVCLLAYYVYVYTHANAVTLTMIARARTRAFDQSAHICSSMFAVCCAPYNSSIPMSSGSSHMV